MSSNGIVFYGRATIIFLIWKQVNTKSEKFVKMIKEQY